MVSWGRQKLSNWSKKTNGRKLAENFFDQDKILNQLTGSILTKVQGIDN